MLHFINLSLWDIKLIPSSIVCLWATPTSRGACSEAIISGPRWWTVPWFIAACSSGVLVPFPLFPVVASPLARLLGLMCWRACRQIVQEALFETLGLWYAGRIAKWKYGTDISLTSLIHTLFVYYDIAEWDLFLRALEFVIFKISQQFYFPLLSTFTSTISHLFLLEWETTVSSIQIY